MVKREEREDITKRSSYHDRTIDRIGHGVVSSRDGERCQVCTVWQASHPGWGMEVIRIEGIWRNIPKILSCNSISGHQEEDAESDGEPHLEGHTDEEDLLRFSSHEPKRDTGICDYHAELQNSKQTTVVEHGMAWSSSSPTGTLRIVEVAIAVTVAVVLYDVDRHKQG